MLFKRRDTKVRVHQLIYYYNTCKSQFANIVIHVLIYPICLKCPFQFIFNYLSLFLLLFTVKPLFVRLLQKHTDNVIAGKEYRVSCETAGSKPSAVLKWIKGGREITLVNTQVSFILNYTHNAQAFILLNLLSFVICNGFYFKTQRVLCVKIKREILLFETHSRSSKVLYDLT